MNRDRRSLTSSRLDSDLTFLGPQHTRNALNDPQTGWKTCRNLTLLLRRYLPEEAIQPGTRDDHTKQEWLARLAEAGASSTIDRNLCQAWLERWERMTGAFGGSQRFSGRCDGRLIVGLGNASPLEVGLSTHAVYGIPYIPGSALKGLARAYAQEDRAERAARGEDTQALALAEEHIFGRLERRGSIVFFDAVPRWPVRLQVDIVNPHFPTYYRSGGPPSVDQDPVPVFFLAVASTWFRFAVGAGEASVSSDDVSQATSWLTQGLQLLGIGAKTSAGYGIFSEIVFDH